MPTDGLCGTETAKRSGILLRESRGVLRKHDKLAASAATEDPPLSSLIAEGGDALKRVVHQMTREEDTLQQRAREAAHSGRA